MYPQPSPSPATRCPTLPLLSRTRILSILLFLILSYLCHTAVADAVSRLHDSHHSQVDQFQLLSQNTTSGLPVPYRPSLTHLPTSFSSPFPTSQTNSAFIKIQSVELLALGYARLVVNVEDANGVSLHGSSITIASQSEQTYTLSLHGHLTLAEIARVTIASFSSFGRMSRVLTEITSIVLVPTLHTSFAPNHVYRYKLNSTCKSETHPTRNHESYSPMQSFGNELVSEFELYGLPYTYDADLHMISITLNNTNVTCADRSETTQPGQDEMFSRKCQDQQALVRTMPTVYITQEPLSGEFVNVWVPSADGTPQTAAIEPAIFVVRLLLWDDAYVPQGSWIQNNTRKSQGPQSASASRGAPPLLADGSTWTTLIRDPRLHLPVRRFHRYHRDGLSLLRSHGHDPQSFASLTTDVDADGGIRNPRCISVESSIALPVGYEDQPAPPVHNTTVITCYSAHGNGPLLTVMHHDATLNQADANQQLPQSFRDRGWSLAGGTGNSSGNGTHEHHDPQLAIHSHARHDTDRMFFQQVDDEGSFASKLKRMDSSVTTKEIKQWRTSLSQGRVEYRTPPVNFTHFAFATIREYETQRKSINTSTLLPIIIQLAAHHKNASIVLAYRRLIQNGGDESVQVLKDVMTQGLIPQHILHDANLTSILLAPSTSMIPQSIVAPNLLLSLMKNHTLPYEVRDSVIRATFSLRCPTPKLFHYLNKLAMKSNNATGKLSSSTTTTTTTTTTSSNATQQLWDSAVNAIAIFSSRPDCTIAYIDRAGFTNTTITSITLAEGHWHHEKHRRLLNIPCPRVECPYEIARSLLRQQLDGITKPEELEVLINALANVDRREIRRLLKIEMKKYYSSNDDDDHHHQTSPAVKRVWRRTMIRAFRRLPPHEAVPMLLPIALSDTRHGVSEWTLELGQLAVSSLAALASERRYCTSVYLRDVSSTFLTNVTTIAWSARSSWAKYFRSRAVTCKKRRSDGMIQVDRKAELHLRIALLRGRKIDREEKKKRKVEKQKKKGKKQNSEVEDEDQDEDVNMDTDDDSEATSADDDENTLDGILDGIWDDDEPTEGLYGEQNTLWNATSATNNGLSWGGENAHVEVISYGGYTFDGDGFTSALVGALDASLFKYDFTIMDSGTTAVWSAEGVLVWNLWLALYSPIEFMGIQDYYVVLLGFRYESPIGLQQGDLCDMTVPNAPARQLSTSITVFEQMFVYGIPYIADVDVQLEVIGSFTLSYGAMIIINNITANWSDIHFAVKGYVEPGFNLQADFRASARLLIVTGDVNAQLNFATVTLPTTALYSSDPKSHTKPLGYQMSLVSSFLSGSLVFDYQVWWCCCPHWYSCHCGGDCDYTGSYLIFDWPGYRFTNSLVMSPPANCSAPPPGTFELPRSDWSSALPPLPHRMTGEDLAFSKLARRRPSSTLLPKKACNAKYVPGKLGSCTPAHGLVGAPCFRFDFNSPLAYLTGSGALTGSYPQIGLNTLCSYWFYQRHYKNVPSITSQSYQIPVKYSASNKVNRAQSLRGLWKYGRKCLDLDESPMASTKDGGLGARIQAINWIQNQRQGKQWGACIRTKANGIKVGTGVTFDLSGFSTCTDPHCNRFRKNPELYCCQHDERLCQQRTMANPVGMGGRTPDKIYGKNWAKYVGGEWQCGGTKYSAISTSCASNFAGITAMGLASGTSCDTNP